jgi:hypothetical protein
MSDAPKPPRPARVATARAVAGDTQLEAAVRVRGSKRSWEKWESGERRMHPGLFELYCIKTGQPVDG